MTKVVFTNNNKISPYAAVWLLSNEYDRPDVPNYVSVTQLLKPSKEIALAPRVEQKTYDVFDFLKSRMGTSIHDSIQKAWESPQLPSILKALGYSDKQIKAVVVNPEFVEKGQIPIYIEQRVQMPFNGFVIGGKYDAIVEGRLYDTKATSVWAYIYGSNQEKFKLQGSIYAYLNPDKVTNKNLHINYIFWDWNKRDAERIAGYPKEQSITFEIPLMAHSEVEDYLYAKTEEIKKYRKMNQEEMADCSSEELWMSAPNWKYFNKSTNKTAQASGSLIKVVNAIKNTMEANVTLDVAKAKACNYCSAADICMQRDRLIKEGKLDVQ